MQLILSGVAPNRRGFLISDPGRLPRETCSVAVRFFRDPSAGRQAVVPVFNKASGLVGSLKYEIRKHIYFSIPEGMAVVAGAGQTLGSYIHSVIVNRRHACQMIQCKVNCKLIPVVSVYDNIAA